MFAPVVTRRIPALAVSSRLTIASSRRTFVSNEKHAVKKPESAYEPIIDYKSSYLQNLLKDDDADAPWHRTPINMVSREVQQTSAELSSWNQ